MKYVPGLMVGQLSGSAGNTVASHNRFGSYLRTRVIPVNPATPAQSAARAVLAQLAADYRTLTDAQRTLWALLGAQMTRIDPLGQTVTLTGLQAYISVNRNKLTLSQAEVATPPAYSTPPDINSFSFTYTGGGLGTMPLTFAPTPAPAATHVVLFATPGVSPGRSFVSAGELRLIAVSAAAQASGWDTISEYQAIYGDPVPGTKVFAEIAMVTQDGFSTPRVRAFDIAA